MAQNIYTYPQSLLRVNQGTKINDSLAYTIHSLSASLPSSSRTTPQLQALEECMKAGTWICECSRTPHRPPRIHTHVHRHGYVSAAPRSAYQPPVTQQRTPIGGKHQAAYHLSLSNRSSSLLLTRARHARKHGAACASYSGTPSIWLTRHTIHPTMPFPPLDSLSYSRLP